MDLRDAMLVVAKTALKETLLQFARGKISKMGRKGEGGGKLTQQGS